VPLFLEDFATGMVTLCIQVLNQRGETALECNNRLSVKRKPKGTQGSDTPEGTSGGEGGSAG